MRELWLFILLRKSGGEENVRRRFPEYQGIVIDCRHCHFTPVGPSFCSRYNIAVTSCAECDYCPSCGGKMKFEKEMLQDESPVRCWEGKTCVNCSHRSVGEERPMDFPSREERSSTAGVQHCAVDRCRRKAYEGHVEEIDGKAYVICSHHKDRMYNWRHKKFPAECRPLKIERGSLVENPLYGYVRKPK